jgi:hypothetical protein
MTLSREVQVAHNNAKWCHAVCRAHGIPGEFRDSLWLNRRPVPRFYSNAITLSKTEGASEQLDLIQALLREGTLCNFSVKDSFCTLNLAPLGFQILFEATWLWRKPSRPKPTAVATGIDWIIVQDSSELARWEAAWNGLSANDPSPQPDRIFLPSLLTEQDVIFIGAYQDRRIVAGGIANRTGEVVGVSNVFVLTEDALPYWAGCVTAIMEVFPGRPLVGYERGNELAIAQQLGFEASESLRVWTR